MGDRHPRLLDSGGSQRGRPDYITRGINVRDLALIVIVHRHQPALAGRDPGRGEIQSAGIALSPGANEQGVARQARAGRKAEDDISGLRGIACHDALAPMELHSVCRHGFGQGRGYLRIQERHQYLAAIHQMHLHTQRGEGPGILAADHSTANDDHLPRDLREPEDLIRIMDAIVIERKLGWPQRRGAGGDQDLRAAQNGLPILPCHPHRMGFDKAGSAAETRHAASLQLLLQACPLPGGHGLLMTHEISDGGLPLQGEIHAEESARAPTAQHQRGLAQRLARDGPGIDPRASKESGHLHQRGTLPQEARGGRGTGTGGTTPDDDEIEFLGSTHH